MKSENKYHYQTLKCGYHTLKHTTSHSKPAFLVERSAIDALRIVIQIQQYGSSLKVNEAANQPAYVPFNTVYIGRGRD